MKNKKNPIEKLKQEIQKEKRGKCAMHGKVERKIENGMECSIHISNSGSIPLYIGNDIRTFLVFASHLAYRAIKTHKTHIQMGLTSTQKYLHHVNFVKHLQ